MLKCKRKKWWITLRCKKGKSPWQLDHCLHSRIPWILQVDSVRNGGKKAKSGEWHPDISSCGHASLHSSKTCTWARELKHNSFESQKLPALRFQVFACKGWTHVYCAAGQPVKQMSCLFVRWNVSIAEAPLEVTRSFWNNPSRSWSEGRPLWAVWISSFFWIVMYRLQSIGNISNLR